jgi:hypothetical protein
MVQLRDPAHNACLASESQGFFSPVVLQEEVLATPVSLHLFEYTARWAPHMLPAHS